METIETDVFVDNEPLFVTYYMGESGKISVRLHKKDDSYSNESNVYGLLDIETSCPSYYRIQGYDGLYLSRFYIFPKKETDNLKGMGKFMLCVGIAVLLKKENFNEIYLRAYGTRYNRTLQNKLLEGPTEDIYEYYVNNDSLSHLYDISQDYGLYTNETKENVVLLINKEPYLKEDLSGFAARIEETKKLINYYKEYNFVVVDDTNKVDVFMESTLDALKQRCLTNKGYLKS